MKQLKVGTFNLYNLALPNVVYYGDRVYSPELYARKLDWTAHQLTCMNADIVGFQEVFQVEALRQAVEKSGLYPNVSIVAGTPHKEGPVVALASRLPIVKTEVIEQFPPQAQLDVQGATLSLHRFSRSVVRAEIALTDALTCIVFVVHLKSKRPIFPDGVNPRDPVERAKGQARALIQRAAEATALRALIVEATQGNTQPVIVMGDINDGGLAVTSQIMAGEPPFRTMPFEQKQQIWDVVLYTVKDLHDRRSYGDFYYTHIHNGHYDSLDHILVSQEFVSENPRRVGRVSYVSVLNDHLIDDALSREDVPLWQSDHAQVVATIELNR
jgi:hypothetical protein